MLYHQPVLINEVINLLDIQAGKIYIDATLGHAGHTLEILNKGGIVYAFDQDIETITIAESRIGKNPNFHLIKDNFANMVKHIDFKVDGILFDLGLSVNQQKSKNRGFSFNDTESLDMRINPKRQKITAENIINTYDYLELFDIFSKIAQEKFSKQIAFKIIQERRRGSIKTGERLANVIRKFYEDKHIKMKIDPATKIFLALRIVVNSEFENLKIALVNSLKLIKDTGVVCVISFHSGEDRIVKTFIRQKKLKNTMTLPSRIEISKNPLARSAVLRSFKLL